MLHFTSDQWIQWLGVYFWPMLRILALITTAPILSEKAIPKRVKVGLGIIITIIVGTAGIIGTITVITTTVTGTAGKRGSLTHERARFAAGLFSSWPLLRNG